ncbi:DNA mismatch repair endonuclease MutL [Psychrosphaera haliotis]|uniref:DNA mismatch repair endonuclease MutL n=1 Tax=Psychrosphaera haliotis TaxID=555083 RepID=UPI0031E1A565
MTIKILPPQLANQIAAGEVVERPASVVKELVENALDAGATKVEIDIERGGHKKILIKDDGKGIQKDQLALALSRHATSKITNISDLEAILSLGFRGEALASISSVARLTMTSKPESQSEAWSAIAEGLDMEVDVKPAAHPNGTTVEVLDLFFNTPARRKFLRAEKTEFSHIESLIRRIAMSRPDVSFVLQHNNKVVKRYRAQSQTEDKVAQQSARIAEVINTQFVEQSSIRTAQYDNISISIWAKSPSECKSVNPAQYSFVNGRMMRDKLIQHAIRQAYSSSLNSEQQPEYVLFVELPANEVDVNVHPAKHEVRFHHSRLLHDLIVGTIQEGLTDFHQVQQTAPEWLAEPQALNTVIANEKPKTLSEKAGTSYSNPSTFSGLKPKQHSVESVNPSLFEDVSSALLNAPHAEYKKPLSDKVGIDSSNQTKPTSQVKSVSDASSDFSILFTQLRHALIQYQNEHWVIDLSELFDSNSHSHSTSSLTTEQLKPAPLLVPIRIKLTESELTKFKAYEQEILASGFDTKIHQNYLIIKQVPTFVRSRSNSQYLPELFSELLKRDKLTTGIITNILNQTDSIPLEQAQILKQLHILKQSSDFSIKWSLVAKPVDLQQLFKTL